MICVEIYRPDEIQKSKAVENEIIEERSEKSSKKSNNSWRASLWYQSDNGFHDPLMNIGV